jgi:hypothetical protein
VCAFFWPESVARAWLPAFLFAWGLSIGCLGLGLLYRVTGGRWGSAGAPFFEAGLRLVPVTALLFIPVGLGIHEIYPWSQRDFFAGYEGVAHRQQFLQADWFLIRAVTYFVIWSVMALAAARNWGGAGFSLMVFVFSVSFALLDWVMSLDPWFASSMLGVLVGMGCVMAALAFVCIGVASFTRYTEPDPGDGETGKPQATLTDLGSLLLASVMLWAYMEFGQFLIIWSGNLPEEAAWYVRRSTGGWEIVAWLLAIAGFWLPFSALLLRQLKRDPRRLALVALCVLVTHYIALCWTTLPEYSPGKLALNPFAFVTPIAAAGLWFAACAWLILQRAERQRDRAMPAEGGAS